MAQDSYFNDPIIPPMFTPDDILQDVINEPPTKLQQKQADVATKTEQKASAILSKENFKGMYDADSPYWNKKTGRIGDLYGNYGQAPELKDKDWNLQQSGINERIRSDNFLMGVLNRNTEDVNLDPQYYPEYKEAINESLVNEADQGNLTFTGQPGHITKDAGQRQVMDILRGDQSLNEDLQQRVGTTSVPAFAAPGAVQPQKRFVPYQGGGGLVENAGRSVVNEAIKFLGESADAGFDLLGVPIQAIVEATGSTIEEAAIPLSYGGYGIDQATGKLEHKWFNDSKEAAAELSGYNENLLTPQTKQFTGGLQKVVDDPNMSKIEKAVAIGKLAYDAKEIIPENVIKSLAYLAHISNPYTFAATVAGETNIALDERNQADKAEGREADTLAEKAGVLAITTGKVGLDKIIDKFYVQGRSGIGEVVQKMTPAILKSSDDVAKKSVGRMLKGAVKAAGTATEAGAVEYFTEGMQTAMEIYAKKFDGDMLQDTTLQNMFNEKEWQEIRDGAAIGALTGAGQSAVGQTAGKAVQETLSPVRKKAQDKRIADIAKKQKTAQEKETAPLKQHRTAKQQTEANDLKEKNLSNLEQWRAGVDGKFTDAQVKKIYDYTVNIDDDADPDVIEKVGEVKKAISKRLSTKDLEGDIVLGSKAAAEVFIEELYLNADDADNTTLNKNAAKVAKQYNISDKTLGDLKSAAQVETEASTGAKGYKTYDRDLKRLIADPKKNKDAINRTKERLYNFEASQVDRLGRMNRAVEKINKNLKDGNQPDGQVSVPYASGGSFKINIKNGKINPATQNVINSIEKTISEINKVYQTHGVKKNTEFDLDTKIRIPADPGKGKGKKGSLTQGKAMKQVMNQLDSGLTIYMKSDFDKKRPAWDKKVAMPLSRKKDKDGNRMYVEVNKDGNTQHNSGRWVLATKAKPAKKNVVKNENKSDYIARKLMQNGGVFDVEKDLTADELEYYDNFKTDVETKMEYLYEDGDIATIEDVILLKLDEGTRLNAYEQAYYDENKLEIDDKLDKYDSKPAAKAAEKAQAQAGLVRKVDQLIPKIDAEIADLRAEIKRQGSTRARQEQLATLQKKRKHYLSMKKNVMYKDLVKKAMEESLAKDKSRQAHAEYRFDQEVDPNTIIKLKSNPDSLIGSVDLTQEKMPVVQEMLRKTRESLRKILLQPVRKKDGDISQDEWRYKVRDSLSRSLIYDENGVINASVAAAIGVAVEEYISTAGMALGYKSIADIARMLDKREAEINQETLDYFQNKGMYTKEAAFDIGKGILKNLGLTQNENIPEEIYYKMVADFGQVGILTAVDQGHIEYTEEISFYNGVKKTTQGVNILKHNEMSMSEDEARKANAALKEENKADVTVSFIKFTESGKEYVETAKDNFEAVQEETGVESTYKKGGHEKPVKTDDISVRNSDVTTQSVKAKKVLDKLRNFQFKVNNSDIDWLTKNKEVALSYMGWKNEDELNAMAYNSRLSAEAKNEVLIRSIEELEDLDPVNTEMYFDWFYSRNGRYMLDSNTINPQTDKLHRFIVTMKDHENVTEIGTEDYNSDGSLSETGLFKFALAQAFGMSTDKETTSDVLAFGKNMLTMDPDDLMVMLEKNDFSNDIEVEELGHYIQGVHALRAYQDAKKNGDTKFTHNLSMESDAVTSGFGLKIMQLPILGKTIQETYNWLAKTGFFVNKKVTSMNDEVTKDGFDDSYVTLAKEVTPALAKKNIDMKTVKRNKLDLVLNEFVDLLPKPNEDGTVSKALRELFKDPFMTFNYSRGLSSIKKGLGVIIANDIMNGLVQETISPEQQALLTKLEKVYGKNLQATMKEKDPLSIKPATSFGTKLTLGDYLASLGTETYGAQATASLEKNFGEFQKANNMVNDSFKAMFQIYAVEYNQQKEDIETKNKRGITSKEKLEIIQGLRKTFPLIKGPFTTEKDLSDSIAIVDNKNRIPEYNYGSATTWINKDHPKSGGLKTKKVQSKIRELEEAMSAGAVIPIHYIDGALMGDTILESKGAILGIHDAIIPQLNNLIQDVENYNDKAVNTNKNYSITQEVVDSLVRVAKKHPEMDIMLYNPVAKKLMPVPVANVIEGMETLNQTVQERRNELYAQDIDAIHMSAVPGSKYEYIGEQNSQKVPNTKPSTKVPEKSNYTKQQEKQVEKLLLDNKGNFKKTIDTFVKKWAGHPKIEAYNLSKNASLVAELLIEKAPKTKLAISLKQLLGKPDPTPPQPGPKKKGVKPDEDTLNSTPGTGFTTSTDALRVGALQSVEGMKNVIEQLDDPNLTEGYKKYVLLLLDAIDPKFIPDLNLYINEQSPENAGLINNTDMIINTSQKDLMDTGEMTSTEVYAHELMHAITKFAIAQQKTNEKVRGLVRQIEKLRDLAEVLIEPRDLEVKHPLDKAAEKKLGQERYNYIFNNKNSLHEFIAHGLTNPRMMKELSKIQTKDDGPKTLFEALTVWAKELLDLVLGNTSFKVRKGTIKNELTQLTFELMESNNKAINDIEQNESLVQSVGKFIDRYGNVKVAKLIDVITEFVTGDPTKFPPKPVNGGKVANAVWALKILPRLFTDEKYRGIRETALSALGAKPEGFLQNVIRDFQTPGDLERKIEDYGLRSDSIDSARELKVKAVRETIKDAFGRVLDSNEAEALTMSGLDLDIGSIYDIYGQTDLIKLYNNPTFRKTEIKKVKTQLRRLDSSNFNWHNAQSTGLGYYLATHKAGIAQNLNAENIARGVLSTSTHASNPKVVKKINQLSTLIGIDYTAEGSNEIMATMIKNDKKGIKYVVDLAKGASDKARKDLFHTNAQMIKGYTKELFDESVEIKIMPLELEHEMSQDGYKLVETLIPAKDAGESEPIMGVYKAKFYVNNTYHRTATRMTNMVKKGTSLLDIENKKADNSLSDLRADKKKRDLQKRALEEVKKMEEGTYEPDPANNITPIIDQWGNISGYRYTMSKAHKKEYLRQDTSAPEVLGRTLASIQDKVDTETLNKSIMDTIFADMRQNYDPDSFIGKNGMEYIPITEDSDNKKVREIYKILPGGMKAQMDKHPLGHIAVRRDMLHNYFGFRDPSFANLLGEGDTLRVFRYWIKVAEAMWQDIVSISKVDIIIRTPVVFLGNIISNFMYSVVMGENPIKVARIQMANMRNTIKYLKNQEELSKLNAQKLVKDTTALRGRVAKLEGEQKDNPVHELMEAGMYQAIVEDIDKRELRSNNRLARRVGDSWVANTVPEYVRQGVNWLYLNENTSAFTFMTKATQYSDFIARATEYQLQIARGIPKKKAMTSVLDTFINYGKPASSFEEYLNQMGLVMFTKYAKRIQRVITTSGREKPVNVLLSILGQEMFLGIDDIWDQHPLVRSYANIGLDPTEHIQRAFVPTMFQYVGIAD